MVAWRDVFLVAQDEAAYSRQILLSGFYHNPALRHSGFPAPVEFRQSYLRGSQFFSLLSQLLRATPGNGWLFACDPSS